jgi:hypothetical protein
VSTVRATGLGIRHAISRALATENLRPEEATYKVLSARVDLDTRQRVVRADVTLRVGSARPDLDPLAPESRGWVNPDGAHPLMVALPVVAPDGLRPILVDLHPMTWDRWLRVMEDSLPDLVDPLCPLGAVPFERAMECAKALGRRLPTREEFMAAWGPELLPWGPEPDPARGLILVPRYDQFPSVGMHPPGFGGLHDLGGWLHHWLDDGTLAGAWESGAPLFGALPRADRRPVGFRCVADWGP